MNRSLLLVAFGLTLSLAACATDGEGMNPTSGPTAGSGEGDLGSSENSASGEQASDGSPEEAARPPIPKVEVPKSELDGRRLTATAAEILNDPAFRERFANSYLAETEIEPTITTVEREALLPILDLIANEQLDEAALQLEVNRTPTSSAVFDFLLANVRLQQDKLAPAAQAYQAAVAKHKKFRRAWQGLGQINFREGNSEQALVCFTKVLELGGGDALTYGILGLCHSRLGNDLSAESAFRQASLLDPDSDDWRLGMAESFLKQGRYAEAIALFDKLIAKEPNNARYWLAQGEAYARTKQPMKAAENFEIVDRLGASSFDSLNNLGDIYANAELYDLAVGAYIRAMDLSPEGGAKRAIRAAKYIGGRGALDETAALVTAIEATHGDSLETESRTDLLHLQARVAVANGATDEQAVILRKIVEVDPLDGEALMLLGLHEHSQSSKPGLSPTEVNERRNKAILRFQQAAGIERFEADAKVRWAQVLSDMKKYAAAIPLLERAQSLKPRDNVQKFLNDLKRRVSKSGS
jgi:tetratricopeptide (TPR) repeat protein